MASQDDTSIDLRKMLEQRKRAPPAEEPGKPFLRPANAQKRNLSRKTFFTKSSSAIISPLNLVKTIQNDLTPEQAAYIAHSINLENPTKANLIDFVTHFSSQDSPAINIIKDLIQKTKSMSRALNYPVNPRPGITQSLPPLTSFPINDIRYRHCDQEQIFMLSPIQVGLEPFDVTFPISNIGEGNHVILQSFTNGVFPFSVQWPNSLIIEINGHIAKARGNYNFPLIDITDFLPDFDLRIICEAEGRGYFFLIRVLQYSSFKAIVENIKTTKFREDDLMPQGQMAPMQVFSPLISKSIEYPGRSFYCQHLDCFDLKDYIKLAQKMQRWNCPICGVIANLDSLYYAISVDQFIQSMKNSRPLRPSATLSPPFNIPGLRSQATPPLETVSPKSTPPNSSDSPQTYITESPPVVSIPPQFDQFDDPSNGDSCEFESSLH